MKERTYEQIITGPVIRTFTKPTYRTLVSRGGLDEIDPEDVIYGEYSSDNYVKNGEYLELVYIDGDILCTFSGPIVTPDPKMDTIMSIVKNDEQFYCIPIREMAAGFAFKRKDIKRIGVSSLIHGGNNYPPSCIWTMEFEDHSERIVENTYQTYFYYAKTTRPNFMTNLDIIDKALSKDK